MTFELDEGQRKQREIKKLKGTINWLRGEVMSANRRIRDMEKTIQGYMDLVENMTIRSTYFGIELGAGDVEDYISTDQE